MDNNPVEFLHSRWLGGLGTKVLYLAILTTIAGVLLMGQSMSTVAADVAVSPEEKHLAAKVAEVCVADGFRSEHRELCSSAEKVLGGAAPGPTVELVDAVRAAK